AVAISRQKPGSPQRTNPTAIRIGNSCHGPWTGTTGNRTAYDKERAWDGRHKGSVMSPRSQLRDPFAYGGSSRGAFSAWPMAIVFAAVAMVSFAIDQTLSLAPEVEDQNTPSLLHPVQLIESLIEAASD